MTNTDQRKAGVEVWWLRGSYDNTQIQSLEKELGKYLIVSASIT